MVAALMEGKALDQPYVALYEIGLLCQTGDDNLKLIVSDRAVAPPLKEANHVDGNLSACWSLERRRSIKPTPSGLQEIGSKVKNEKRGKKKGK